MTDRLPPRVDVWCDLQCPDCRPALGGLAALRERHGDELVLELRHFPLDKHRHALLAAQAAEEARVQGALWPYAEAVLARAGELARANEADAEKLLVRIAGELGLDAGELELAIIDGRHFLQVDMDHAEGLAIGVKGTPTYEVAGKLVDGRRDPAGVLARVEELLGR